MLHNVDIWHAIRSSFLLPYSLSSWFQSKASSSARISFSGRALCATPSVAKIIVVLHCSWHGNGVIGDQTRPGRRTLPSPSLPVRSDINRSHRFECRRCRATSSGLAAGFGNIVSLVQCPDQEFNQWCLERAAPSEEQRDHRSNSPGLRQKAGSSLRRTHGPWDERPYLSHHNAFAVASSSRSVLQVSTHMNCVGVGESPLGEEHGCQPVVPAGTMRGSDSIG